MTARLTIRWILLLGLACPARALADPVEPHAGTWALEFQLQPLSGSTKYGLATKYHMSDRSAARLGFLVGLGTSDGNGSDRIDRSTPYDSSSAVYRYETATDQHSGSVFLHFVRYATVAERFGLSLDMGPVFGWGWSKRTDTSFPPPPSTAQRYVTYESSQKAYGLEFQAGFEWHFVRRLSLAGRYGFSALRNEDHQSFSNDQYDPTTGARSRDGIEQVSDGFSVQTTNSVFSLIAYW